MVRLAVDSDIPRITRSFSRAFANDPVWRWFVPADDFIGRISIFGNALLRYVALPNQATYTTDDGVSAAIWMPPVSQDMLAGDADTLTQEFDRCFGANLVRYQQGSDLMGSRHPHDPHWYLAGLATHPDWQGQGLASAALQPVLERCDAEQLPAYLEATKEANVAFYQRHSFALTGTLDLPGGGPTMYLMWREPQPR